MRFSRLFIPVLFLLLPSCTGLFASPEAIAAERRAALLQIYPVGTTRAQVQAGFQGREPMATYQRPGAGWATHADPHAAYYAARAEKRLGRRIPVTERYFSVEGWMSLRYVWFYLDRRGQVMDLDWQWSSD